MSTKNSITKKYCIRNNKGQFLTYVYPYGNTTFSSSEGDALLFETEQEARQCIRDSNESSVNLKVYPVLQKMTAIERFDTYMKMETAHCLDVMYEDKNLEVCQFSIHLPIDRMKPIEAVAGSLVEEIAAAIMNKFDSSGWVSNYQVSWCRIRMDGSKTEAITFLQGVRLEEEPVSLAPKLIC